MLVTAHPLGEPEGPQAETYWKGPLEVQWSLTFPIGQEPAPEVVRAIRAFYPQYVPLWCVRVHLHPDGREKRPFGYHVIGRWRESPDADYPDPWRIVKVDRPSGFPFRGGVIYEQRTVSAPWPDHSREKALNTPDRALPGPVHMEFANWMKEMYYEARGALEGLQSRLKRRALDKVTAEAEALEKLEEDKQYELMQYRTLWNRAIDEGRLFDEPREYQPQPYAFLGAGVS